MLDQLAGAATDVVDRNAVSAETAGDVHVLHACERVEEVGEGVSPVEWVHEIADVWCGLLQNVVAGEHDVGVVEVEADVTRRVAGGVDNAEAAAGECDDLVVDEKAVGSGLGAHRRLTRGSQSEGITVSCGRSGTFHVVELVRHPLLVTRSGHLIEQVVVVLVHGDPSAGCLADPSAQSGVVRMEVRDHDALDVGHRMPDLGEPRVEALPAVVVTPASVDQDQSAGGFHGVDERVPERVVRDRDRNLEYAITDGRRTVHNKYLLTIRERTLSTSCLPCARLVGDTGPAWREFGMFSGDFGSVRVLSTEWSH